MRTLKISLFLNALIIAMIGIGVYSMARPTAVMASPSGSWSDGFGGYVNGSAWIVNNGIYRYAWADTTRTPSHAYNSTVTAEGWNTCGNQWHMISSLTRSKLYGSAQANVLAGSTQCPDSSNWIIKSVGKHAAQISNGTSQTYYGATDMSVNLP